MSAQRITRVWHVIAATLLVLMSAPHVVAQTEVVDYYAVDAVGSIRVVFRPDGTVVGRADYAPFGEPTGATGGQLPPVQFTGQERDPEAVQDNFHARYYQTRHGRFGSVDPIFGNLFDPQQLNRYAYALNSPLSFMDPTGRQAEGPRPMFQSSVDVCISCYANWLLVTWYGLGGFASRAGSAVAGGVLPDEGRGTGGGGLPTVGNALGSDNDGDRDGGRALDGDGQRSEGPDVTEPASPDSVETTRGSESCVSRWRFASSVSGLFGFNDTWGETALDLLDTSQTLMFFYDLPSAVYKAASHGGPQGTTGWASTTNKITRVLRKSGRLGPRQARQIRAIADPLAAASPSGLFFVSYNASIVVQCASGALK